ncbi:MAG: ShlB/FhaC/HecB family hemolysin secretion/activation protein [Firmicutes bacterium]|nr:ShlB/FhaC/HecB family hemolysin secretion/activation protein [Bacillota bacterium]
MRSWGAAGLRGTVVAVGCLLICVAAPRLPVAVGAEASQEANTVYVRKIVTDPSEILTEAEIREMVGEYEDRNLTIDELRAIVERINALYAERGYVTAQAFLPPQTVEDGIVHITLIEGRVGEVAVVGNNSTHSSYVTRRMSLRSGDLVRLDTLEADIARFNETNDVQLHAQLKPGESFGTTDINFVLYEPPRFAGTLSFGNSGRSETGMAQSGITLTNRSLFGRRDAFDLTWRQAEGSRSLSLAYEFPVGLMGSRMSARYDQSEVGIFNGAFAELDVGSKSYGAGIGWRRPLVLEPGARVDGFAEFQDTRLISYFSGAKLTSSHTQRMSLGFVSQKSSERSSLETQYTVAYGRYAEEEEDEQQFLRYNASVTYQSFPSERWTLRFRVNVQISPDRLLPPSEQFSVGGGATVRGYSSGTITGDQGYFVSADATAHLASWLNGFVFLDHGAAYPYKGKSKSSSSVKSITSTGVGFTFAFLQRFVGTVVYGIPLGDDGSGASGTLHFHVEMRF